MNETPKKRNAVIFGPHHTAAEPALRVERWLCAENYSVTKHVLGLPGLDPTVKRLKTVAQAGFGVFVYIGHGSESWITVEEFDTEQAAQAKLDAYRADADLQDIRGDLRGVIVDEGAVQRGDRYAIALTAAGLRKLFGGPDPNRSIVVITACRSWNLQKSIAPPPFGATEFLGFNGDLGIQARIRALDGFDLMGGSHGIPKRPVIPAFSPPAAEQAAKYFRHSGPGNTTLAPASTDHSPPDESELVLNQITPGFTIYETTMKNLNPIMTLTGCDAQILGQVWTNNTRHDFGILPTKPGRMILRVNPTVAVSNNNDNWLIGNRHILPTDLPDPGSTRPVADACPFGQSGLDGLAPCVPPINPFRWCVWCDKKPIDPPPGIPPDDPKRTPEDIENAIPTPRLIPPGERDAFILYQDAPDPNTVLEAVNIAPNMTFAQAGPWYGHVVFEPDLQQLGAEYTVEFRSQDLNGLRSTRTITWQVPARLNELTAFLTTPGSPPNDLGVNIVQPSAFTLFHFIVSNTGNTVIRSITLNSNGLTGPEEIPPASITITPSLLGALLPGASIAVTMEIQTASTQLPGLYAGSLGLEGSSDDGAFIVTPEMSLRVNSPPIWEAPVGSTMVGVGDDVRFPLNVSDPDDDTVISYLEAAPFGAALILEGGQLYFEWQPISDFLGRVVIPLVADDGNVLSVHDLQFFVVANSTGGLPVGEPTLSEWGLVLLAALCLATGAFMIHRRSRKPPAPLSS